MKNRVKLMKLRYRQLGRYNVTMIGSIIKWENNQITFMDESQKQYNLSEKNLIRLEPVVKPVVNRMRLQNEQIYQEEYSEQVCWEI